MKRNRNHKTVHLFSVLLVLALMWLAGGVSPATLEAAPPRSIVPPPPPAVYTLNELEQKAVLLLNAARKAEVLEPLKVNLLLSRLAADYALDMNRRNFFAHFDPDGKDPFDRMAAIGIDYPNAGENIALSPDVETAHKMLMDSPLHRENIMQPKYTEIGIGVRPDSRGGVYLVQEFIGP